MVQINNKLFDFPNYLLFYFNNFITLT
jgi:hypothetical protein